MDIEKYIAGKGKGVSGITIQGGSTVLISWPAGFDPETGAAKPPNEQGFQPADISAMRESAAAAVTQAEEALAKAQARVAAFDALVSEVEGLLK